MPFRFSAGAQIKSGRIAVQDDSFAICQIRQLVSNFAYFSKVSFGTLFGDIGSDGHLFLQNREGENLGVYKV